MELKEKDIEDWIKPYATIVGNKNDVDLDLRKKNPAEYFLRLTLPNNYESYAIALHSFWINHNIPKDKVITNELSNEEFPEKDFSAVTWKDFYERKNLKFNLNKAILNSVEHNQTYEKQLNNELYPSEGSMDEEQIINLVEIVKEIYGNQEIELFYTFLATKDWKKNLIYNGKISELPKLLKEENLRLTPSLIYPKERNWVVNTDYDLSFSTIGGESKFISKLEKRNSNGIIRIER